MTTPNEPNKTRTIPLHIADQAVAACEAEIQKLKTEVARLDDLAKQLMKQHSDLSCENIMLRKAGDEMVKHLGREWVPSWVGDDWNAAKEGKFTE